MIVDRIDAVLEGLCPCGGQPRPGSPYCSYDCEPNIRGVHTDTSEYGDYATPMRWRPDLVTEAPDDGLTLVRTLTGDRFRRQLFTRDGTDLHHLRLDNGHRFVGCDVRGDASSDEHCAAWERLERELGDPCHAVPDDQAARQALASALARYGALLDAIVLGPANLPGPTVVVRRSDGTVVGQGVDGFLVEAGEEYAVEWTTDFAERSQPSVTRWRSDVLYERGHPEARDYFVDLEFDGAPTPLSSRREALVRSRGASPHHFPQSPRRIDPRGTR